MGKYESEKAETDKHNAEKKEKEKPKTRDLIGHTFWLAIVLIVVFSITLGAAAYFADKVEAPEDVPDKIYFEIVKYLLQLAIVIIIGGFIAYLFREAEQRRQEALREEEQRQGQSLRAAEQRQEQARARVAIRVDYLSRVGNAYRNVKAARRALQAGGLTTKKKRASDEFADAQAQLYREEMSHINEAQLVLEGLRIEAKSLPEFIPVGGIADKLRTMESYLRRILLEYEENWPDIEASNSVVFSGLKWLVAFTGSAEDEVDGKSFSKDFSKPYEEVVKVVSKHLLENGTGNQ